MENIKILKNYSKNMNISWNNNIIEIFENLTISKNIDISGNWNLNYLFVIEWKNDLNIKINIWDNINWKISAIIIAKNNEIKINNEVKIIWNKSKINVHILSLIWDYWRVWIEWGIRIWNRVNNSEWNLLQENIILGKNTKIKTIPRLDINSKNIIASHWSKIEHIDKNKLFYIMSKWLSEKQSNNIIIEWYINNIFKIFDETEEIKIMKKDIFEKIKK